MGIRGLMSKCLVLFILMEQATSAPLLQQPKILCVSDTDCNYHKTGLACLDQDDDGPKECDCDPGTIWVPEAAMCLSRGGVLCDYWNFLPDNSSCASGHCITKCRAAAKNVHETQHSVLCMDVCATYVGENGTRSLSTFSTIILISLLMSGLIGPLLN